MPVNQYNMWKSYKRWEHAHYKILEQLWILSGIRQQELCGCLVGQWHVSAIYKSRIFLYNLYFYYCIEHKSCLCVCEKKINESVKYVSRWIQKLCFLSNYFILKEENLLLKELWFFVVFLFIFSASIFYLSPLSISKSFSKHISIKTC